MGDEMSEKSHDDQIKSVTFVTASLTTLRLRY